MRCFDCSIVRVIYGKVMISSGVHCRPLRQHKFLCSLRETLHPQHFRATYLPIAVMSCGKTFMVYRGDNGLLLKGWPLIGTPWPFITVNSVCGVLSFNLLQMNIMKVTFHIVAIMK